MHETGLIVSSVPRPIDRIVEFYGGQVLDHQVVLGEGFNTIYGQEELVTDVACVRLV